MSIVKLSVKSTAARWWVVIEDGHHRFEKPQNEAAFDLPAGKKHAMVYAAQGNPGKTFKLTATDSSGKVLGQIDRLIGANGMAYGHKGFTP